MSSLDSTLDIATLKRDGAQCREQLLRDGYLVVRAVLTPREISRFRQVTDLLVDEEADRQRSFRSQGSMIPTTRSAAFVDLITNATALAALAHLGWPSPNFTDGYVISKSAGAPPLFWHYDWFAWNYPGALEPQPPQLFAMYYLTDTTRANGCLRAIPGSHVTVNALHRQLTEPHSQDLSAADDLDHAAFSHRPDEVDVPVRAGDLVLGDARLLHAAHANASDERRTVITLWYQPDLKLLPEAVQAQMVTKIRRPAEPWPVDALARLEALLPTYAGNAQPLERQLHPASCATVVKGHP